MLYDILRSNLNDLLKAKDRDLVSIIKIIISDSNPKNQEKYVGDGTVTNKDVIQAVKSNIKGLEAQLQLKDDPISRKQLDYLILFRDAHVPLKMSEDTLRKIMEDFKASFHSVNTSPPNIGNYMKYLKENYPDQYDGKLASIIAKSL